MNLSIKYNLLIALSLLGNSQNYGQTINIVENEGINTELHRENIGKITFMSEIIPIEIYDEPNFLSSFELKEKCDLNIRTFLGNSLTNYLHKLSPESSVSELTSHGNFQFTFYVDGVMIYKENLNIGAGSAESKNKKTVFRVPLISSTNEDSWGRFMWNRFMQRGGEDALESGEHLLNIEIRSYLNITELKVGDVIAQGKIKIVVVKPKVDEKDIDIQDIKKDSGWLLSTDDFDKKKIRTLNQKIAEHTFKDVTSIVVIKDGKLLLEEYFNGSHRDSLHDTRSVGKSFTSTLLGIAIKDRYVKNEFQSLHQFYNLHKFDHYSITKENITIKDLLTMSSAFDGSDMNQDSPGNEENMYPSNNWVKFALDLPIDSLKTNGGQWDYFTAGVILLGDILQKSVPQGLEKYAQKRLFQPLGIKKYEWQYTPQHVVNTAGGLKMSALDFAKYGQLYQNKGMWNGKRILTSAWCEKTFSHHLEIPGIPNEYYGYLFWNKLFEINGKSYETYYCTGNGGSKIYIFKDLPLTIVITAKAYNMPYAHPQVDKMMQRYILSAVIP